jgi:iron complex outermembrane receptor protein
MKPTHFFQPKKLALSVSLAIVVAGTVAMAQDVENADGEERILEEVVVTGFRRSLTDSIEAKRSSSSVIEAISAEEIGKLPDVSIAESLGRLPGVAVARLNGRGQVVNIRGLSPDFSTGLLNGREQVSVGDNRGVEFDQYPSELLSQVIVYKTPDAALIGQGLSGTVDLRTVRPLEYGERKISLNAQLEEAEYDLVSTQDNRGHRYSASYIDQFADDTIGVVLGVASISSPNYGQNNNAWGYYAGDGNGNVAVGGGRVWARASDLERDSFVAAIDFEPNDRLSIEFDAFISSFEESQIKHGLVMNLNNSTLVATETSNGVVTAGTQQGTIATENNVFLRDADSESFGINVEYDMANDWTLTLDLSRSKVERSDTAEFESNGALMDGNGNVLTDTIGFRTGKEGSIFSTGRDYSDVNSFYLTSPFGWGDGNALAPYQPAGQFGYNKVFDVNDEVNAFRAELAKDIEFGPLSRVEVGVNRTERDKDRVSNEGVITSGVSENGALLAAVPLTANLAGTADMSFGMFGNNTQIMAYDPYAALRAGLIQQGAYLYDDIFAKAWNISEEVTTAYVKFDIDTEVAGIPVTGNIGVAYQSWDQSSNGTDASGAGANLVTYASSDSDSDSEILPSLNLAFEIAENQLVRFAMARNLARPRMDEMKAVSYYSADATKDVITQADIDALAAATNELNAYATLSPWTRNGGNTKLKPWIADNIDLSYEFYFDDAASYLAAAVFYKDLKSYIYNQQALYDFTGRPTNGASPQVFVGISNQPANGEGGSIKGYELAASISLGMINEALDGFGVVANYSYNDSQVEANGPGSNSPLPGLSEKVYSLTAYYEKNGFSARINQRYRDGYVGEIAGFGGARTGTDVDEETLVDAQIGYEFQSGMLNGLSVTLQGINLTDERQQRIDVGTGLPTEFQTFGSTYLLGVSYSL